MSLLEELNDRGNGTLPGLIGIEILETTELRLRSRLELREALMAALAGLAPRQRACVVLRYFEDLSVADTAALLRCTEGTVKSQTSRALFSLRSTLEESPSGEPAEGAVSW